MNPNRKQRPELKKNSQIHEMLYMVNAMAEAGDYASRTHEVFTVLQIFWSYVSEICKTQN